MLVAEWLRLFLVYYMLDSGFESNLIPKVNKPYKVKEQLDSTKLRNKDILK